MSFVYDGDSPDHAGKFLYAPGGLGILGSLVPSTGIGGRPGLLYNEVVANSWQARELRLHVISATRPGLFVRDDSSWEWNNLVDGVHTATYKVYVDGVLDPDTANLELIIGGVPVIVSQPAPATRTVGQTATFSVSTVGGISPTYQWYANSVAIPGANSSSYTTPVLSLLDSGVAYRVRVSSVNGFVDSDLVTLTVINPTVAASITAQPVDVTVVEGQNASFSVAAVGTAPLTYQWKVDGVDIVGAIASTYTKTGASLGDDGNLYTCMVSNAYGSELSDPATLSVTVLLLPPVITGHPQNVTVTEGSPVLFTVSVTGSAPLQYQWSRNGAPISGATGSTYFISSASDADNLNAFSVQVTNSAGSAISDPAILYVAQEVVPEDYPMDLSQWPPGRVTRFAWSGYHVAPLDAGASEFFAFDFGRRSSNSSIVSATVDVSPFYPKSPPDPDYLDGVARVHGSFVVQKIKSPGKVGKHVVVCRALLQNGATVSLNCNLYILRSGQGYIPD